MAKPMAKPTGLPVPMQYTTNCFLEEHDTVSVNAILSVTANKFILLQIKDGYVTDKFCQKVQSTEMKGWCKVNGLWYIGDRLLVPWITNLHKCLLKLAHDMLGHFGADKLYATLWDSYNWPNMRRDLEQAYIPA
jgi:hypothetical protein